MVGAGTADMFRKHPLRTDNCIVRTVHSDPANPTGTVHMYYGQMHRGPAGVPPLLRRPGRFPPPVVGAVF